MFGVSSTKRSQIRLNAKQTCLERYGVTSYAKTEECKEKIKQTNLERYGVEYPMLNKSSLQKVLDKRKEIIINRYNLEKKKAKYGT